MQVNLVENPEMKATSLQKQKKSNSYLSDTVFKGTVVNRTLPSLHNLMRFMCKNSQTKKFTQISNAPYLSLSSAPSQAVSVIA